MINFMAKYGRGLICLAMTGEQLDALQIPMMVGENTSKFGTAFTVSIEARHGVTTGISAADRAKTILTAIDPKDRSFRPGAPGTYFPVESAVRGSSYESRTDGGFRGSGPIGRLVSGRRYLRSHERRRNHGPGS